MPETICILKGRQAKYNTLILQTLWTEQPLTAWELTSKIHFPGSKEIDYKGKVSLHATLNKSLRRLEKKGYVLKKGKQWILNFKGLIVYLIIQPNPKLLSQKWINLTKALDGPAALYVKDFQAYVRLATLAKKLMEEGVINFDVIKNRTLATFLIAQDNEAAIDKILEPKKKGE